MQDINTIQRINSQSLYGQLIEQFGHANNYNNTIITNVSDKGIPYITFKPFYNSKVVKQVFSTRLGGVSNGMFESMNLTFNPVGQYNADAPDNVLENFRRMATVLDIPVERMVYTRQTHTTNVMVVDDNNAGMGIVKPCSYNNIDGLVTNTPGLCLVASFADCIPVILVDEEKKVIANLHAGWRGTVDNIAHNGIKAMTDCFGCKPENITAFIGPGICMDCYEVSEDVAKRFQCAYIDKESAFILKKSDTAGKYKLNLLAANFMNLINLGVQAKNIYVADVCTSCNSDILFSHRASKGQRGILCNFIYLK